MRRLVYREEFEGLEQLVERLQEAALFARLNDYTKPAIEARALPVDRTLRPSVEVYLETLSDKSTQLVAVVLA
jgi:hypothetical protein